MSSLTRLFVILFVVVFVANVYSTLPPPCDNAVYCYGPLLHTVQTARIFNDSKTFVDMKMKNEEVITLSHFEQFKVATRDNPTQAQVRQFVNDNFEQGDELEKWTPTDYNPNPAFLNQITEAPVKELAGHLVKLWAELGRKVKPEVIKNSSLYSFIPVPNGFVIPGGRFREYYYWDSYWIIKGLLISGMGETAKGMIDNFLHIVKILGFLPNGGRIYYKNRSQPPLLTKMALEYYKYSGDKIWLQNNIQFLDTELTFWLEKKTTKIEKDGKIYSMAHYIAESTGPRPESYLEDFQTAEIYDDYLDRKQQLYVELKSGAESGWDFSTRWIFDEFGGNDANLSHIQTTRVIPVDLNSYLSEAFKIISTMYSELGNKLRADYWNKKAEEWEKSIEHVLWANEDGIWYDFDVLLSKPRKYFYVSNITPLWCGCFNKSISEQISARVVKYLIGTGALNPAGGTPTSLTQTGEQWDLPNAWPPLQAIIVQGLERVGGSDALALAKKLAEQWVNANVKGFKDSKEMFEKYDAIQPGKYGGGGEYTVQSGFGWTNGVALEFIEKYFVKK